MDKLQPRVVSFEEQVTTLREHLASLLEQEEDWSRAAQTLAGIDLDSGRPATSSIMYNACLEHPCPLHYTCPDARLRAFVPTPYAPSMSLPGTGLPACWHMHDLHGQSPPTDSCDQCQTALQCLLAELTKPAVGSEDLLSMTYEHCWTVCHAALNDDSGDGAAQLLNCYVVRQCMLCMPHYQAKCINRHIAMS